MRFVYAGAMGKSYDVETVIKCAKYLHEKGFADAQFLIAGNGPKAGALSKMAESLPNVKFFGWLNEEALAELLDSSHIGIACYARSATQSVTYKLFDYLGAGLPILCSLPGEMSNIIESEQIGYTYPAEDVNALAKIVQYLSVKPDLVCEMSERARTFAEHFGDSRVVYHKMVEYLEKIV
jgi:glycosyltransferase involved in cell wall biosynthesis